MQVTKAAVLGKLCVMARAISVQGVGGEVLEADFLGEGELSVGLWTHRTGVEVMRVGGTRSFFMLDPEPGHLLN